MVRIQSSNHKISVVVLNFNGKIHLKECFQSLLSQSRTPDEIIMIDNMSRDGSREYVKKYFPTIKIVAEDSRNIGTVASYNLGAKMAIGEYLILQSNDLKLDRQCIKELVKILDKEPNVGIVCAVSVHYHKDNKTGKHLIDNAGGIMDMYGFGMQKYPGYTLEDIPEHEEVFFTYGNLYIIRKSVLQKVGWLDERFFAVHDDVEISWRVRQLGYKVLYTKKAFVYHKVSPTIKTYHKRSQIRYWSERNCMRTLLKNHDLRHLLIYFPLYLLILFAEMGYFLYRRKFLLFLADLKAIVWNCYYLPETLTLRHTIQRFKKKNNIYDLLGTKSFKLQLSKSFRESL